MKTNIELYVKDKVEVRTFLLEISFGLGGKVKAEKNVLSGEITNYDLSLKLLDSLIEIKSIPELEKYLHSLLKLGIPLINTYLKKGIKIPYIEPFFSFHKSEFKLIDRYIKMSINPAAIPKGEEGTTGLEYWLSMILNRI